MTHTAAIAPKHLAQYGMLAMPVAFAGFPLYVLAPDFYAVQHGLSLGLLGSILLLIRLLDGVQDPVLGWLADRYRKYFMLSLIVAGTLLVTAIYSMFNAVIFSPALWFALTMIMAVSSHSIISIILGAQATLWTHNPLDQTRLAGAREGFALIGLVIAVSAPSLLAQIVDDEKIYVIYTLILAALMAIGLICFSRIPRAVIQDDGAEKQNGFILSALRALPPQTRKLMTVYAASMLAASIPAVLVIFYVRDLLQAEALTGLFLLAYFLSGAISMPVWKNISQHHGKYKSWLFSIFLAVAGFIGAFFLQAGDVWQYAIVCVVSGFALGADLTLPPSILADDIHRFSNHRFAGTFYAMLAFLSKASLAFASVTALWIMDAAGFIPQQTNTDAALFALAATYALVPCALKLCAAALLYRFFIHANPGEYDETTTSRRHRGDHDHA
ncbi:MAG TPA: MFS transporter [Alphaproteobacteria bacterium]|nr:sugar transporter [Rhodospirillaceae bacterium]HRJ12585.1 MFS transporter [Alphaproteobacteria bacterium]